MRNNINHPDGALTVGPRPAGLNSAARDRLSKIATPDAFEAYFRQTSDLVCIRDLKGKLVRLNRAWTTTLGFSLEALHGAPLLTLIHPDDVWETHDVMDAVTTASPVVGFRNRYRCQTGGYRQLEWSARLVGDQVFGVGRNITPTAPGARP